MHPNARWPLQLLHVGDSFEVHDPLDFNSAKSSTSQYKAKNPDMIFTQRISCGRCGTALASPRRTCACKSKVPRKMLTIKRWR